MNRLLSKKAQAPTTKAIQGLPRVNYYLPIAATMGANLLVMLVVGFLTLVAFGNVGMFWSEYGAADTTGGILFCGLLGILGLIITVYFLLAFIKGVRDLLTPMQYTRGTLADKRTIGGRLVGNWLGITPSYAGPNIDAATTITDEQSSVSADRSRIVQTRNAPVAAPAPRRRGSYLSPERVAASFAPLVPPDVPPGDRAVFRVEGDSFENLSPGEEVLVAHSRFLEHIYFVAHMRDGEWESFRSKALI